MFYFLLQEEDVSFCFPAVFVLYTYVVFVTLLSLMQQANTMATESLSQSKQFSPVSATSYWSHSKCEYTQINFEWTIDRLAIVQLPRDILTSPKFSAEETPEVKWKLWYKQTLDGDLQIRVSNRNTDLITPRPPDPYPVRVQMSILNRKREKILTRDEVLYEDTSYHPYLTFPNKNQEFFKSDSVQKDGSLIIYCEIHSLMKNETLSGMAITNAQHRQHRPFDCNNELVSHLEELFENRTFTDITMSVGNSNFEVHKSILAVRSPVFAAMFAHLTSIENSSNKIEIQDVEPDVFQEVLRFIYTGRVPLTAMENVAAALLAAADKYFFDQLKKCQP